MVVELLIENNRPGTKMRPTTVTIHNTANPDSTARNNRDYFSNHKNARASSHYIVDDVEVIRCIPEDEVSWHAGAVANSSSISIEVCEFTSADRQRQANENAADLIVDILARYGWGYERIKTHQDWTGKYCPRKLLPMWDEFLGMVKARMPQTTEGGQQAEPLVVAVRILQSHGIISSPEYWLEAARPDQVARGDYVYMLIVKMAQYLDHWR